MSDANESDADAYAAIVVRLRGEFAETHPESTVAQCVTAAKQGATQVTGAATPDLVERIARQHLRVLDLAHSQGQ